MIKIIDIRNDGNNEQYKKLINKSQMDISEVTEAVEAIVKNSRRVCFKVNS